MGLCAYTVKKEQGRQRYDWDPQTPETIGQSVVLAVLFFICWDCSGNDFLQSHEHGDEEYAGTMVCGDLCACGAVVGGLLQPVRRCPEEALCVDPGGDPDLPDVAVRDHLLCIGSLRIVSGVSDRLCTDDAQRGQRDPALFRAGLSTGDLLRSCWLSAVDRGFGTDGRKRKVPFLGDDRFYGHRDLIGDIH